MSDKYQRTWRNGPPPSIGWWPASWSQTHSTLRYWDGFVWSLAVYPWMGHLAAENGAAAAQMQKDIQWTDRWWHVG